MEAARGRVLCGGVFAEAFDLMLYKTARRATGTNMDLQLTEGLTSSTTSTGTWTNDYIAHIEKAVNSWTGFSSGESVLCYMLPGEATTRIGKMTYMYNETTYHSAEIVVIVFSPPLDVPIEERRTDRPMYFQRMWPGRFDQRGALRIQTSIGSC